MHHRLRDRTREIIGAVFGPKGIERDEIVTLIALGLIARGFWLVWQPGAYLVPGLVLLWLALPPRHPFLMKPQAPTPDKRVRKV